MASFLATTTSPVLLSSAMQPTPHPVSSTVFGGRPWPFFERPSFNILDVVDTNSVVSFSSVASSTPVMGSSDSKTIRCFEPRSWIRSPRITATAPFAKPTAIWERSSSAANAEMGNCLRALPMETVLRQVGMLVFLTSLSSAQTFSTGSLLMSSATVTSRLVPSTCRMLVMLAVSCAWKRLTTFQLLPMMLTQPSCDPRNRLSEPAQTLDISLPSKSWRDSVSGREIWATSKKSNDFHCRLSAGAVR